MVQFSSLLAAGLCASGAFAAPAAEPAAASLQPRFDGNGFNNWSEGGSNIRCVNGQGGSFTANWNSKGGFVCGKGWNGQGARYVHLTGRQMSPHEVPEVS
jgi:endo-1,4-beta-xylanase